MKLVIAAQHTAQMDDAISRILEQTPGGSGDITDLGGDTWCAKERSIDEDAATELAEDVHAQLKDTVAEWSIVPSDNRRKRLLISDMDSTIIGQECVDELADFAGKKAEVAEITERAMRGELDFEGALTTRVEMLKGLSADTLEQCLAERIFLNPGARTLVNTMKANGARCVLVSGGFTFFTTRVAKAAGFHCDRANTLIMENNTLTGEVGRPILGREAKQTALEEETAALGLSPADALAIGDGANDLAMIEAAGLGVAYRAKPVVAAQADAAIKGESLEPALFFQGYKEAEFVRD